MTALHDYAVSPGDHLSEWMDDRGLSTDDMARRLGTTPESISGFLSGELPLADIDAARLERVTGIPVRIWVAFEDGYRKDLKRLMPGKPVMTRRGRRAGITRRAVYVSAATGSCAAVLAAFTYSGYSSLSRMMEPDHGDSRFEQIAAAESPGIAWARQFTSASPVPAAGWSAGKSTAPSQPVGYDVCQAFGAVPQIVLGSSQGASDGLSIHVGVYGAGQAIKGSESLLKAFSGCWKVTHSPAGTPATEVYQHEKGFFFTYGDAVVSVIHDKRHDRSTLIAATLSRAASTLKASGCVSLTGTSADSLRSPFYDGKSFTGLLSSSTVPARVQTDGIPAPVYGDIADLPDMEAPEGPLPDGMPSAGGVPDKPSLPQMPPVKNADDFTKTATYRVADVDGPGCGWAWSGQLAPVVSAAELEKDRQAAVNAAQEEADDAASAYVSGQLAAVRSGIAVMSAIEDWNAYASRLAEVHEAWRRLNAEREKLRGPWFTYLEAHEEWESFPRRRQAALEEYDARVDACNKQNEVVAEWDRKYGTASSPQLPSPSPTESPEPDITGEPEPEEDIPPRPQACASAGEKPAILSQERGSEPQPPAIPEGVTIPGSWKRS